MKAYRNLTMVVVALAATAALSIAPAFAFAQTLDSDAPQVPAEYAGGAAGDVSNGEGDVPDSKADGNGAGKSDGNGVGEGDVPDDEAGADGEADDNGTDEGDKPDSKVVVGGQPEGQAAVVGESGNQASPDGKDAELANTTQPGEAGKAAGEAESESDAKGDKPAAAEDGKAQVASTGDANANAKNTTKAVAEQEPSAVPSGAQTSSAPASSAPASSAQASSAVASTSSAKAAANTSNAPATLSTASVNDPEPAEAGQLTVQDANGLDASLGPLEIAIAKELVKGAAYESGVYLVEFAAEQLLPDLFGEFMTDDTQKKLDEILKKLDEIEGDIKLLSDKVTTVQLQTILNDLKELLGNTTPHTLFQALQNIDDDVEGKQLTPEQAKTARLNALTEEIGIENPANANADWDQYVDKLWTAMTTQYDVTIDDQPQKLTLMQTYYELLRRTYKWEHQAYEEWAAYQGKCVSLLMSALTLEEASLQARMDLLEAAGRESEGYNVGSRYETVTDWIDQVVGKKVVLADGAHVVYPGLFSEDTWEKQYWMYKERPDYRYYWVPGHEVLFFAQVNTQDVPKEPKGLGLDDPDYLKGIKVDWSIGGGVGPTNHYDVDIVYSFWKPFLSYQGGDYSLVSADTLKTIYKDYGSDTHLYNIFIDEKNGNFLGLDEGNIEHWWFPVAQDKGHKLHYDKNTFKADQLYCSVVTSPHAEVETAILCKYHYSSHEANNHRHYIGIGVARMGPETYRPEQFDMMGTESAKAEVYTAVTYDSDSALWWPSRGDLVLGYGGDTHGDVGSVTMDGVELDPSHYTIQDGKIVLSQAFLASLAYGEHELFLDTAAGGHTIVFSTKADPAAQVAATQPAPAKAGQMPPTGDTPPLFATAFAFAALLSAALAAYARTRRRSTGR